MKIFPLLAWVFGVSGSVAMGQIISGGVPFAPLARLTLSKAVETEQASADVLLRLGERSLMQLRSVQPLLEPGWNHETSRLIKSNSAAARRKRRFSPGSIAKVYCVCQRRSMTMISGGLSPIRFSQKFSIGVIRRLKVLL